MPALRRRSRPSGTASLVVPLLRWSLSFCLLHWLFEGFFSILGKKNYTKLLSKKCLPRMKGAANGSLMGDGIQGRAWEALSRALQVGGRSGPHQKEPVAGQA